MKVQHIFESSKKLNHEPIKMNPFEKEQAKSLRNKKNYFFHFHKLEETPVESEAENAPQNVDL